MRNARTDANQKEIVAVLRSVGASVQSLAPVGHGVPDLLVGFRGITYLIEVKTPTGKLTPDQIRWHGDWRGGVGICITADDALMYIGAIAQ